MFIDVDRESHVPAYVQIRESMRALIVQGALRAGERLPSTRDLAKSLGVNRITIHKALNGLEAEGVICSAVGRGTFVCTPSQSRAPVVSTRELDIGALWQFWGPLFVESRNPPPSLPMAASRNGSKSISLIYAAPPASLFPVDAFRRAVDFVLKRRLPEIARLGPAEGLPSLRLEVARMLAQIGITASDDNIVITNGCQQSLDLLRRVLVKPGNTIVLENPTYPGAVGALSPTSLGLHELPILAEGPDLRAIATAASGNRPKLVYVSPNFHNPTGYTMPADARRQLMTLTGQMGIPVIEDDVFGPLRYDGAAVPSLQSLSPHLVIYIGSFSKILSPGLRLGWIVAPRPVVEQVILSKQAADAHSSLLLQVAMDEFCKRDIIHRHLKKVRKVFRNRRDAMAEALRKHFPSDATWRLPEGGLSLWVTLTPDWNTEDLSVAAKERGVQFLPGSLFYFRSARRHAMRLSFATEDEPDIRTGIRILGETIEQMRPKLFAFGQEARERTLAVV